MWLLRSAFMNYAFHEKRNTKTTGAATRSVLYKKLCLKITQYSQENTRVGLCFQ